MAQQLTKTLSADFYLSLDVKTLKKLENEMNI